MKNNYCHTLLAAAGILASPFITPSAPAANEEPASPGSALRQFFERDYLLGDWGGLRSDLSSRGIDFEFFYAGSVPTNLDGGIQRGSVYQGALLMALDLDSQKLAGYHGGRFHASSLWIHGRNRFSQDYIGDLNKVNLVDFENQFRLWELWYSQKFLNDRFTFKLGQMVVDADFIVPEFYNSLASLTLLNQTFFYPTMAFNIWDQPYFPVGRHALPSTPYGAPGALLRWEPADELYAQAAVYDGNPDQSKHGTRVRLSSDEGALAYFEAGYRHNQGRNAGRGLPGNYKVGAYYHTDDFFDMYQGSFAAFDNFVAASGIPLPPLSPGPARTRKGNYGFYFLADQTLWRENGPEDLAQQGIVGFFRAAIAPEDRNLASYGIDGGLVYKGLIPTRDWDTLAVAASYLSISKDLRRAQRDINATITGFGGPAPFTRLADYEAVVEVSYKAQLAAWWTVQPSIQRVIHPGGRVLGNIPDSWAFIVQTTLRF